MADGMAALDAQIRRLRELERLAPDAAPDVARAVDRELGAQIAAGRAPDGTPWPRTQRGTAPLRGAAKALRVRAMGSVVLCTLEGPEALHHLGRARGGVRRQILPSNKIPTPVTKAISEVVKERFRKTMGAR